MRFIIYGAGGIGSGIGGHLWRTGHDVILIGRPGHVSRIQASGLQLITGTDEYRLDVPAVTHPRSIDLRGDDVVLLTMKSQDTEAALRELRAAGGDPWELPIFCAQNSIANEMAAAREPPGKYSAEELFAMAERLAALEPPLEEARC